MTTPAFNLTATERVLPKLALDFATASLDSRITLTRTTGASNPATYVNSNGLVTAATNNQPRFDYDHVTLVCRALMGGLLDRLADLKAVARSLLAQQGSIYLSGISFSTR